jgi:hypothetical protein
MERVFAASLGMLFAIASMAARAQGAEPGANAATDAGTDAPVVAPPDSTSNAPSSGDAALPAAVAPGALEAPAWSPNDRAPPPAAPPTPGRAPPFQEFNHVSIYGAPTLGTLNRAMGAYLGFPLVGVRAAVGASPTLDLGLGFDSFYGSMNEFRVFGKHLLTGDSLWTISAALEGGAAFFAQRPDAEGHGPRWLTGRRNFNVEGGAIASYRGRSVQSARLFLDARYQLAIDTQPYAQTPLGGVPPRVQFGHNLPLRMGAEMPFSPSASFLFVFGFEIHGRPLDSRFMPVVGVGLVAGL